MHNFDPTTTIERQAIPTTPLSQNKPIKKVNIPKLSRCNRLELETLGHKLMVPKNTPGEQCLGHMFISTSRPIKRKVARIREEEKSKSNEA